MTIWEDIAAERLALAAVFDELTDAQWRAPSLCGEWSIHELAAHLVMPFRVSMPRFGLALLRARGNFEKANVALTARVAGSPSAELVADFRANAASHFTPPGMEPIAPLSEILIHGQDVRIPVGVADTRDPALWAQTLAFLVTPAARRGFVSRRIPELELVATDVDWRHGSGPRVGGPAYALALALARRAPGVAALSGPGQETLAAWVA